MSSPSAPTIAELPALLAVPPEAGAAPAHRALVKASRQDNADTVETLIALSQDTGNTEFSDTATQRWELDGGVAR